MQVFNPNDPNLTMLEQVARSLGPELCTQFVFVGGAAAGLLITDLAMPAIRRTDDVDIVISAEALADYDPFEDQLRGLGFVQDQSPDAPVCRWRVDGVAVDLMPTQEEILGFTNRWYRMGVATAQTARLDDQNSTHFRAAQHMSHSHLSASSESMEWADVPEVGV